MEINPKAQAATIAALTPADPRVHQVELIISTLLRVGVSVSLGVVIFGTIVTFVILIVVVFLIIQGEHFLENFKSH